ncbi:MAG: transglutaminase-like domain-containing protein [Fimbriimonadaceae bacterium]
MLMRLGYDLHFEIPAKVSMLTMLYVHPSRTAQLVEPDEMKVEPGEFLGDYIDGFGNRVGRVLAPKGPLRLSGSTLIEDPGRLDSVKLDAREHAIEELPNEVLQFLLNSRYCEVDRLSATAVELFGWLPPGWSRVQAICDWVHWKVAFGYHHARPSKTALDVYTERAGVCRDFQHLAITFCRALNIPARYATGYLGDIGVPVKPPADFSAWFEVYLDGTWWVFDARNNVPRLGRVAMAVGRDASDVAITTSFGIANLVGFNVVSEVQDDGAERTGSPTTVETCDSPRSALSRALTSPHAAAGERQLE